MGLEISLTVILPKSIVFVKISKSEIDVELNFAKRVEFYHLRIPRGFTLVKFSASRKTFNNRPVRDFFTKWTRDIVMWSILLTFAVEYILYIQALEFSGIEKTLNFVWVDKWFKRRTRTFWRSSRRNKQLFHFFGNKWKEIIVLHQKLFDNPF